MRGYRRPLGWNLSYTAPRTTINRFRYPWNQWPSTLSDNETGSWAHTQIVMVDGATLTNAYKLTLLDGIGGAVQFQFRKDGNPADAGCTLVAFLNGDTANQVRDKFVTAIIGTTLAFSNVDGSVAGEVSVDATYKSSYANFPFQPGQGGLVRQQDALLLAPNQGAFIPGDEGCLAVPARLGMQRMMPTRTISVSGPGEPEPEG